MELIVPEVTEFLEKRLNECDEGHDYRHSLDVTKLAISTFIDFPEMEDYQKEAVILACLFHETNDHKFFPPEKIIDISKTITEIYPNIDPRIPNLVSEMVDAVSCSVNGDSELSPSWKAIPRYADRTFATGSIGITRTIIYAKLMEIGRAHV